MPDSFGNVQARDYGFHWRGASNEKYRLTWYRESGELRIFGHMTKAETTLATIKDQAEVDRILAGWPDHIHDANSLQWVRERVSSWVRDKSGANYA